jgi:type III secretion protein L
MGPGGGEVKARILKGGGGFSPSVGTRRLPAEVCAAAQRSRDVLAAAEADARRIRESAEGEREQVLAGAVEAGRQEGLARAAAALAAAAAERDRLLASAEAELVRLALAVAGKVVAGEVALSHEAVTRIAAEALEAARDRREVLLRVHPADAGALRAQEPRLAGLLARARAVEIREDPCVGRGGVVVETEAGVVDARIETRLEALRSVLLGESGP